MVNSGEIIKEEDGNLVDEVTLGFEAVTKTPNEAMISAEGIVVALEEASVAIGSCKTGDIKTTIPVEEEDLGEDLRPTMANRVAIIDKTLMKWPLHLRNLQHRLCQLMGLMDLNTMTRAMDTMYIMDKMPLERTASLRLLRTNYSNCKKKETRHSGRNASI